MGWTIERWTDPTWTEWTGVSLKHLPEELNGHIEAVLNIPNTSANRTICDSDTKVRITYDATVIFIGILYAPEYSQINLEGFVYNECIEKMKKKTITNTYDNTAANTILTDICDAAGVEKGSCPTTQISVRFFETECFEAAKFVAECCRKDWWPDYDVSENPQFNIGDLGSSLGSITTISISRNKIDRAKQRNHVVVRGVDSEGVLIKGEAYLSNSTIIEGPPPGAYDKKTKTFTEKKAFTVVTLNKIAAKKLEGLMKEFAGAKVKVGINIGYDIYPGDEITLNEPELKLVGDFRIYKTTKDMAFVDLEVEAFEITEEHLFEDIQKYEDLGIYPVSSSQFFPILHSSEGLVLLLHLDEGLGTVIYDNSKNLHQGDAYNTTWITGKYGKALNFNGTNAYAEIPDHASLKGMENASWMIWYYADYITGTRVFLKQGSNYLFGLDNSKYRFKIWNEDATLVLDWAPTDILPVASKWKCIIVTYDSVNGEIKIYIDGALVDTVSMTAGKDVDNTSGNLYLGAAAPIAEFFDGRLDEIRMYERCLSAGEASTLYLYGPSFEAPPIQDIDEIRDVEITAPVGFDSTDIEALSGVDADGTFRAWFRVTIPRVNIAQGYILAYRESGEANWLYLEVEQPAAGDAVVVTPFIRPSSITTDRTYYFKACAVSKLNNLSDWTSEVSKVAAKDTVAPSAPSNLVATAIYGGVLLEWDKSTEKDLSHYEVYKNTVNNSGTATKISDCKTNYFIWHIEGSGDYVLQYFWVKAIDYSGNASAFSTVSSATPDRISPVDLQIETRPWTSNFNMQWVGGTDYDHVEWGNTSDINSNATIEFADGTTKTITTNDMDSLSAGVHYFYWESGTAALQHTTSYSNAVGEGKGLIAIVQVYPNVDEKPPTIVLWNSYIPTIGCGALAAKSILTEHLRTGCVTNEKVLNINSPKIVIDGTVYLSDWRQTGDLTKISGGNISTGTVDAAQIAADAIIASKIKAGEVNTGHIRFDLLASDPTYVAGLFWYRTDVDQLRFSAGTQLEDVSIIPKEPLYEAQARQENLITNADFEIDRDGDEIPDFWTRGGGGTYVPAKRITTDSIRGSACLELKANGGSNHCNAYSPYTQVKPGIKYLLRVKVKGEVQNNNDLLVRVYQYERDKTAASTAYKNYFLNEDAWPSGESQDWYTKEVTFTADADTFHIRIRIFCYQPTSTGWVRYDDITFSEQKAAIPSAEIVAASSFEDWWSSVTFTTIEWKKLCEITVPNANHEILFCHVGILRDDAASQCDGYLRLMIGSTSYPMSGGIGVFVTTGGGGTYAKTTALITIPKNVKNETVEVWWKPSQVTSKYAAAIWIWGHSPHSHR